VVASPRRCARDGSNEIPRSGSGPFFDVGSRNPRGDLRSGLAAREDPCGDLLDLPAARLRPDHPRRLHSEAPVVFALTVEALSAEGPRTRIVRHVVPSADPEMSLMARATRPSCPDAPHGGRGRPSRGDPLSPDQGRVPRSLRERDDSLGRGTSGGRERRAPRRDRSTVLTCLHAAQELRKRGVSVAGSTPVREALDADLLLPLITGSGGSSPWRRTARGGFGSAVMDFSRARRASPTVQPDGVHDRFVEHGSPAAA